MDTELKAPGAVMLLAAELKRRRRDRGLSQKSVAHSVGLNQGQLSRFEAGLFKRMTPNLHKLCFFMQMPDGPSFDEGGELGVRFERFATQSDRHRVAAEELLRALELLG